MDILQAITGLGAATGAVLVVFLFLKDREQERKMFLDDRKQDRLVWENHLSKSIQVQSRTTETIGELVTAIKVMQSENNSGLVWAREAMQSLIREVGRTGQDIGNGADQHGSLFVENDRHRVLAARD